MFLLCLLGERVLRRAQRQSEAKRDNKHQPYLLEELHAPKEIKKFFSAKREGRRRESSLFLRADLPSLHPRWWRSAAMPYTSIPTTHNKTLKPANIGKRIHARSGTCLMSVPEEEGKEKEEKNGRREGREREREEKRKQKGKEETKLKKWSLYCFWPQAIDWSEVPRCRVSASFRKTAQAQL